MTPSSSLIAKGVNTESKTSHALVTECTHLRESRNATPKNLRMGGCTSKSAPSVAAPVPSAGALNAPSSAHEAPVPEAEQPKLTKEQRRAEVRELKEKMEKTLELLRDCKEANRKNLMGGKLDTPHLSKLDEMFPFIKMGAGIVAELAIPPPGGHCVKIALDIAHQVIKELASNQVMMGLAETCVEHMMLTLDDHKIEALNSDPSIKLAFEKFKNCISDIQAFIWEAAGKDSMWLKRLITLKETQEKLESFNQELKEVERVLQLGVNVGAFAFLSAANQAKEDVKKEIEQLLSKYPDCRSVEDLAKHKIASQELTGIMGELGTYEVASLAAIANVVDKQGCHTLLKNKTMRQLWADKFAYQEKVQWASFWAVFPAEIGQEGVELIDFFKEVRNKEIFQGVVENQDPEHVDVNEINCVFDDDTSLHERAKAKVEEFIYNQGAENQVAPVLKSIPENLIRPDRQQLMDLMLHKKLVVVQGAPGEGKYIAACQAGQALFKPASKDGPGFVQAGFQAIYTASLAGCGSKDAIDNRLRDCLKSIPRLGACDDQIQASLNILFAMDSEEKPYKVLLILDHTDEVPEPAQGDFYARLKSILFKDAQPTNFTIVMSSRVEQPNIGKWEHGQFKDCFGNFHLEPLSKEVAAKIFLLELERKEGEKPEVTLEQAEQLADGHGRNPEVLKLLAGSIEKTSHLTAALKSPIKRFAKQDGVFNDMLLTCLMKLGKSLPTLMLLVDIMPNGFTGEVLIKILEGWYDDATEEDEVEDELDHELKKMRSLNLVHRSGQTYNVVPMIKDYVTYFLRNPNAADNQTLKDNIELVKGTRTSIFRNFVVYALDLLETMFKNSMQAYSSAFPLMASNKPHVQNALKLVVEQEELHQDPEVVTKVLEMLSIMVYDPLLYHLEFVQDVCLKLAEIYEGNQLISGTLLGIASAFYRFGLEDIHGHRASLARAEKALELLKEDNSSSAIMAKAVAFRSKGLILRDLYQDLEVAVESHKTALELLKSLSGNQRADVETILHLAELSGTLDYLGSEACHKEGIAAGKQAIDLAKKIYIVNGTPAAHPVTALAMGAVGYNLRNTSRLEEALDMHKQAYEMRLHVCSESHQDTAMSIQQMGLCFKDMGRFEDAEKSLKQSLDIREFLERTNRMRNLIGNTQYELASLYLQFGKNDSSKRELAIDFLKKAIATRLPIMEKTHKKVSMPCKELIELLRNEGRESEAEEYEVLLA